MVQKNGGREVEDADDEAGGEQEVEQPPPAAAAVSNLHLHHPRLHPACPSNIPALLQTGFMYIRKVSTTTALCAILRERSGQFISRVYTDKKKTKLSSYIRKFRWDQVQSHI